MVKTWVKAPRKRKDSRGVLYGGTTTLKQLAVRQQNRKRNWTIAVGEKRKNSTRSSNTQKKSFRDFEESSMFSVEAKMKEADMLPAKSKTSSARYISISEENNYLRSINFLAEPALQIIGRPFPESGSKPPQRKASSWRCRGPIPRSLDKRFLI